MKIALIHDFLLAYAGAERVLEALYRLFPEAPIYTVLADQKVIAKHFPKAQVITSSLQRSWIRHKPQLLLPFIPQAIESFDLNSYDLVISSSGAFSHGIITGPDTLHISYCHSPMRYAWDWHHEYLAEKGIQGGVTYFFAEMVLSRLRIWDKVSANRVDHWLANSKTVQARIKQYYRDESTVVYPPVDTDFFDPSLVKELKKGEYAVTVSRLTPNKRIDLMIEACATAKIPLHIAGDGSNLASLEKLAQKHSGVVHFLGAVSEEQKRQLIAESSCFLFAAEDDFGIAPVEALALGIPVIAFGKGGATETVQDGKTGYFFMEPTGESLSKALARFKNEGVAYSPAEIRQSALPFNREHFLAAIRRFIDHATVR